MGVPAGLDTLLFAIEFRKSHIAFQRMIDIGDAPLAS